MRKSHSAFIATFVVALAACGQDETQLNCDDLLTASEVSYAAVAAIVTDVTNPRSCAPCHTGDTPIYGLNFETPRSAYHDLRERIDRVYAQVASGEMPKGGPAWSNADLRLLRSWYCQGALYD